MNVDARARAIALCERARAAIDRSGALAARTAAHQVRFAKLQDDLAAARRGCLAEQAAQAGRPATGRPLHANTASGRVVRPPPRRRQAAAYEANPASTSRTAAGDRASDDADGEPRKELRDWARATVFAERVASDGDGHEWKVRELDATGMPGAQRPRCLIFENQELVRRLWRYPAEWTQYSDAALFALAEVAS